MQEESDNYTYEVTVGINLNTIGGLIGGGNIRYAKQISPTRYHHFSLDICNIKHDKEEKTMSRLGSSFVPGKSNYLLMIRPQYGREFVLFKKSGDQGVQINWLISAGPTIGLLAPYMIWYEYPNKSRVQEQYDPAKHTSFNAIFQTGSLGESFARTQFKIGASLKSSFLFEVGMFKNNVFAVEVGGMIDAMNEKMILMPLAENDQILTSAFVTLSWGGRKTN